VLAVVADVDHEALFAQSLFQESSGFRIVFDD
jgi:hypothetical protein